MEYLFLIYADPDRIANASPEQRQRAMNKHWSIMDDATGRGIFRSAAPLEPVSKAVTVRNDSGTTTAIDGPFAETKEVVGGYYRLDCSSSEEARTWAERISDAASGAHVEVRGVGTVPPRPAHA